MDAGLVAAAAPAYGSLVNIALLFMDGLLFGLAAKKGLTSIVLLAVALVLAGYIGLSIQFLSPSLIASHVVQIAMSTYSCVGPLLVSFPIAFVAGLGIGLWKG